MQFVLVTRVSTELDKNIHFKFVFLFSGFFSRIKYKFSCQQIWFSLTWYYTIQFIDDVHGSCWWYRKFICQILITFLLVICVVSLSLIFFCISFYSTCLIDIVLYLCEKEHVEGGMIFQLLEDLTEMSTMRNCEDVFGYIESKQDILGKVCLVFSCCIVSPWE